MIWEFMAVCGSFVEFSKRMHNTAVESKYEAVMKHKICSQTQYNLEFSDSEFWDQTFLPLKNLGPVLQVVLSCKNHPEATNH